MSPQRVDATSMVPALQRALHPEILDDHSVVVGARDAVVGIVSEVEGYVYRGHEHKAK